jgi:hypothetical protein
MCAARQKQVKSPVQEVLPESKDSIAHPLVAVILAARVNNTKPETKSNKEGNNARPVAAMLATQVEEAVARPNSKSHDDVANPVAALCPYGQNHDYGELMVSDFYATLNATHSLRNISVEIHSMYTTNLARIIRSTNLEH